MATLPWLGWGQGCPLLCKAAPALPNGLGGGSLIPNYSEAGGNYLMYNYSETGGSTKHAEQLDRHPGDAGRKLLAPHQPSSAWCWERSILLSVQLLPSMDGPVLALHHPDPFAFS